MNECKLVGNGRLILFWCREYILGIRYEDMVNETWSGELYVLNISVINDIQLYEDIIYIVSVEYMFIYMEFEQIYICKIIDEYYYKIRLIDKKEYMYMLLIIQIQNEQTE